ncbi:nucleotidyltransferase [Flavipsychrobacter stenotrophus]|uniref:Nucleotidyltransferase n=1 Tax=Flavipsychrobacter stenotrophus TaxID=2077091 RepID=A0A2S7SRZ8_9BACT|nr:nucleotidyltransferase [Flavipsychrobacter stenotrophus]PQJ09488.1 nucleotidyltransferase [Flavipsychrobacter stenotrophus]
MGRSIRQIQDALETAKNADPVLSVELTSNSKVAIWKLWCYVVAFCQNVLEFMFDMHKAETDTLIAAKEVHKLSWYVQKAKYFQYGHILIEDTDTYETIDEAAQIVTEAAAVEVDGQIWLKTATDTGGGVLGAIDDTRLAIIQAYMDIVKDGGVRVHMTSRPPDDLQLQLTIFYNPLVLDANGSRIDGANDAPVKHAIAAYLNTIPFNGVFVLNRLIDTIRGVEGVVNAICPLAQARYGILPFAPFTAEYATDSGYLLFDTGFFADNITYTPHL